MTILILCAGDCTRFDHPAPKQLISLGSESILGRIVRQVQGYNGEPLIVTHIKEIALTIQSCMYFIPEGRRYTCETLLSTASTWKGQVIVLLGDVIYSAHAMSSIMQRRNLTFFTDLHAGEIIAVSFNPREFSYVQNTLANVIGAADQGVGEGKLWQFYRWHNGLPLDQHLYRVGEPGMERIKDWTTDIDKIEDYDDFMRDVVEAGLLDDVPERA